MLLALFLVEIPPEPFSVEPYVGANEDVSARMQRLKWTVLAVHLFCFLGLIYDLFDKTLHPVTIGRVVGILSMLAQVISITMVCQLLFTEVDPDLSYSDGFKQFYHWFQIEIVVTFAGVACLILFLFMRTCFKQRGIQLWIGGVFEIPQIDFLDAQLLTTGFLASMTVPFVVVHFIKWRLD
jgi:hypothetical protein